MSLKDILQLMHQLLNDISHLVINVSFMLLVIAVVIKLLF